MQQPLKEKTIEELKEGYIKVARWTIQRETAKTEEQITNHNRGLIRLEEYENELRERGISNTELSALYLNSIDIIEEANKKLG